MEIIRTKVAGINHGRRKEYIQKYTFFNSNFRLEREPDNPYDPNAIKVLLPVRKGRHELDIGFIPRKLAAELAPKMDAGANLAGKYVIRLIGDDGELKGLIIKITQTEGSKANAKSNPGAND